MNISFDGMISNTLPNERTASFFKRGRNEQGLGPSQSKRVRRAPYGAASNDGAVQQAENNVDMSDDSFSSATSLDELAVTLREVNQRLDSSLLDFSSNTASFGARTRTTGMNTSMNTHSRFDLGSSSGLSIGGGTAITNSAPLAASRGPPPLMNFARIPRGEDSLDRL
jgi:hypothetical protein